MFAVIYSFTVKPNQDEQFLTAWEGLTKLIYQYVGSKGSRLHKTEDGLYIAYAQWPEKSIWKHSGSKLPKEADLFRAQMRDNCEKIETLFELEMVKDLLD